MKINRGKKGWKSKSYSPQYKKGVLDLFKKYYLGNVISSNSFFNWVYIKNPAGRAVIRVAVSDENKVVGFYGVIPQKFVVGNKEVLGSVSLNTLVDVDYRRLGVFVKLAKDCYRDCRERNILFTLGFPNPFSYHGFVKKLGFFDLMEVPLLIRPYRVSRLISFGLKRRFLEKWLKPLDCLLVKKDTKVRGKIVRLTDDSLNRLWKDSKKNYRYLTARNKTFIDWRLAWPQRKYIYLAHKVKGELLGYMVLGFLKTDGLNNALLVDFVLKSDKRREEVVKDLLNRVDQICQNREIDQLGCLMVKNSMEYNVLKEKGFFVCPSFLKPQPMRAVIKWHKGKIDKDFLNEKKWFLTMIDYDVA